MQQHGSKYFACRLHLTLRMWSGGQNTTLSEHGHVAYQIKENQECSIMVANILPSDQHPVDGVSRSKHCHVAYQIIENQECNNML